ncbi:hypothetical protein HDU97_006821 [Phlyctochytrium planicorne]|nr:hypothetical protein HDU97_006821 [Phlyctochytrium planicorne]
MSNHKGVPLQGRSVEAKCSKTGVREVGSDAVRTDGTLELGLVLITIGIGGSEQVSVHSSQAIFAVGTLRANAALADLGGQVLK